MRYGARDLIIVHACISTKNALGALYDFVVVKDRVQLLRFATPFFLFAYASALITITLQACPQCNCYCMHSLPFLMLSAMIPFCNQPYV